MLTKCDLDKLSEKYQDDPDVQRLIGEINRLSKKIHYIENKKDRSQKKWIHRKESLLGGKIVYVPSVYDSSFAILPDNYDFEQVLRVLKDASFCDAYVFDPDLDVESHAINRISNLIQGMGKKGFRIHVCLNEIPDSWKFIMSRLSVISITEGLKQVR